ncbi:hypothetical protein ACN47E_001901 [Coniothyrium glycines]
MRTRGATPHGGACAFVARLHLLPRHAARTSAEPAEVLSAQGRDDEPEAQSVSQRKPEHLAEGTLFPRRPPSGLRSAGDASGLIGNNPKVVGHSNLISSSHDLRAPTAAEKLRLGGEPGWAGHAVGESLAPNRPLYPDERLEG